MSKTLVVVCSLGKNVELAEQLMTVLNELGEKNKMINLVDIPLPLYSTKEESTAIPSEAKQLAEEFASAGRFIIVAPEYNGSMPPVLNNAVAWISRGGGDNWRSAFNGKYAVVATHSGGGGLHVLKAIRGQFEYLGCTVLARGIQTNFQKSLNPESAKTILTQLINLH